MGGVNINTERITLRLNKSLKKELQLLSREEELTLNALINKLLEEIIIIKLNDDFDYYKLVSKDDLLNFKKDILLVLNNKNTND